MKARLVTLPNDQVVNPSYVTAIEFKHGYTLLWVVKNSGYGTASYEFAGDQRQKLKKLLEQC